MRHWWKKLKIPTSQCKSQQVTIADAGKLISDKMVPNLSWSTQGNTFVTDARVFPLSCYDMVLGMD